MTYLVVILGLFYVGAFVWFWFACSSTLRRNTRLTKTARVGSNLIPFERGTTLQVRKTQRAI